MPCARDGRRELREGASCPTDVASDLLETVTCRVRVLSLEQVAATWCGGRRRKARQLVTGLERAGLSELRTVLARPVLLLESPVLRWSPGDVEPEFGQVAYRLKTRWRAAVVPTEIVIASAAAAKRVGGFQGGRWPRASEVTHDLHLAAVYLWYRTHAPEAAKRWVSESELYAEGGGKGERLPDAVIRLAGVVERVVEFGGSYGKQKLAAFHAAMSGLSYEIW